MGYHYGKTIREYRMFKNMTLSQLAQQWPGRELGVSIRYVSDIERGVKFIVDLQLLRELAKLLDIPLWKLGLSEYNPFQEIGETGMMFDSDSLEERIQDLWIIRMNVPLDAFTEKVHKLVAYFDNLITINPLVKGNIKFLRLLAHIKRLEEIIYTEKHNYSMSLKSAQAMLKFAEMAGDKQAQAIALCRIGVELLREDKPEDNHVALQFLEQSCDIALGLSKELIGFCFAMCARGYAQVRDVQKFEKTIETAIAFGDCMVGQTVVTKDYVFHSFSGILEEKSNGFILLGEGDKALEVLPDIEKHIKLEKNSYLNMWIPLDYAQAHMWKGDIEKSITELNKFYENIKDYKSARINRKVIEHLAQLDILGYGDIKAVREFKEMIIAR